MLYSSLNSVTSELVSNLDSLQFWSIIGDTNSSVNLVRVLRDISFQKDNDLERNLACNFAWRFVALLVRNGQLFEHEFVHNFGRMVTRLVRKRQPFHLKINLVWARICPQFRENGNTFDFKGLFCRESSVLHVHAFFSYLKSIRKYSKKFLVIFTVKTLLWGVWTLQISMKS